MAMDQVTSVKLDQVMAAGSAVAWWELLDRLGNKEKTLVWSCSVYRVPILFSDKSNHFSSSLKSLSNVPSTLLLG